MLLQDFQHAGSVVLHAGLAYALDLGQVSSAGHASLHHLGQLRVGEDRVDRHGFPLGDLLSQVTELGIDGEVLGAEQVPIVDLGYDEVAHDCCRKSPRLASRLP